MKQKKWRTKRLLALALLLAFVLGLAWASQITSVSVAGTGPEVTPTLPSRRSADLQTASIGGERNDIASSSALFAEPVEVPPDANDYFIASASDAVSYSYEDDTHILRIDLQSNEIRFRTAIANQDQGGRQSVAAMAQDHGAIAAINADYFCLDCDPCCGSARWPEGMTWIDGEDRTYRGENYWGADYWRSSLAVSASNQADIAKKEARQNSPNNYNVVGGGPQFVFGGQFRWTLEERESDVLINDEPFKPSAAGWRYDTRAKTAAGISADGRWLILAVSTGGKTMDGFGQFLIQRGVANAIRLDSGESSAMYYNGVKIAGRDVADALLVIPGPPPSPPPAPSLSSPSNGASLRSCENITLDWNESSGASEYYAEYWGAGSDNWGWSSGTDWNIGIKSPGTYSWHAKARNEHGEGDWSDTWSFTVNPNQAPNTPSLQSPGDGAWINSRTMTLQWQDNDDDGCPRGTTYNVEIWRSGWSNSVSDHSGTSWQVTVPSDDDYQWRVQAYDGDLTSGWSGYRTVKVDATPPDTSITDGPSGVIPTGSATFTWTGSDNRISTGDLEYSYQLVGLSNDWSSWSHDTSVTYNGLTDGDYTFEVKARDLAGNEDQSPASRSFGVDVTPPETTISGGPSGCIGTADVTLTWTGSDNRTPTDQLQYSIWLEGYDPGWSDWSSATSKTYSGLPDGLYTFHVKAKDGVGHEDPSPATRAFHMDTTPPTGSVLVNGGDSTTNKVAVHLDISGDDGPGCGVTEMRFSNDGFNWKDWQAFTTEGEWLLPTLNRTMWTVHLQLKDLVGNTSGFFTDDITLDLYPPRLASENYQLGARVAAAGDGAPASASYQLLSATAGQTLAGGGAQGALYRLQSGFQGAWPSESRGRPPAESYGIAPSVVASSGGYQASESYWLRGTTGQPVDHNRPSSENHQLLSGYWGIQPLPCRLLGDFDRDCEVTVLDIMQVASRWNAHTGDPGYDPAYDLDSDGDIDIADIAMVANAWGETCSGGGSALAAVRMAATAPALRFNSGQALRLLPERATARPGDLLTFDLTVSDVADLGAYQVTLEYDPTSLELVEVQPGPMLAAAGNSVVNLEALGEGGQVSFGAFSYGDQPGATGDGVLARITLRVLKPGEHALALRRTYLVDTGARSLALSEIGGAVVDAGYRLHLPLLNTQH